MITIFNRKELAITYSVEEQARIRGILAANAIDYDLKIKSNATRSIGARGLAAQRFGANPSLSCEYIFYVLKTDYERAADLIKGQRN